ncbi:MAG: MarR family transcriptional regulator [Peptostreptococcaceae bacterium]|nr:MarR family transcriptional regulator [Peptostreptococcaceae bacterium]
MEGSKMKENKERKYYLLAMLIRELYSLSMNSMDGDIGPYGITPQQMIVLKLIAHKGFTGNREMTREMKISKGTASGIIRRLIAKGLICKEQDQKDRRQGRLVFTEAGRAFAESIRLAMNESFRNMFQDSSEEDLDKYEEILREMSVKMRAAR